MTPVPIFLAALIFGSMAIEASRAAHNERTQRARGGVEPAADRSTYRAMQIVYPGAFAILLIEASLRGAAPLDLVAIGAAVFVAGKALKWWAILELGPRWTFRVIVVPGVPLARGGPYRYIRHPNYVGVMGELAGAALMAGAVISGPIVVLLFAILIARRVAVEQRALGAAH